ncbi:DUF805 domain-containing protein [Roseobacter sp. EG26]|uniref:DUF805 domain-containing protein n=1 Tax=Roseobacter sp. EG26 TaxID=3412477 RepID=UPI003CE53768
MTFTQSIRVCFAKYVTFSGRASRSEYWKFWLFWLIVMVILTIVNSIIFGPTLEVEQQLVIAQDGTRSIEETQNLSYNSGVLGAVFLLAIFVPGIAVACRRLHDIGRSGWWQLMPVVAILAAVPILFIATLGWTGTIEAFQTTGNVRVQLGPVGGFFVLVNFGCWLTLLVWLCKKSQPGPNKYGPNPTEVTP